MVKYDQIFYYDHLINRSIAKSPLRVTFILYVQFYWAFGNAPSGRRFPAAFGAEDLGFF
jgi:hypothetical protein